MRTSDGWSCPYMDNSQYKASMVKQCQGPALVDVTVGQWLVTAIYQINELKTANNSGDTSGSLPASGIETSETAKTMKNGSWRIPTNSGWIKNHQPLSALPTIMTTSTIHRSYFVTTITKKASWLGTVQHTPCSSSRGVPFLGNYTQFFLVVAFSWIFFGVFF